MRYEHLVQINDVGQAELPLLERAQLWLGLVARAERPELFDPTIDATELLHRDQHSLELSCRRSSRTTLESVRLVPEESIEITVGAGSGFAGSVLTVRIEEPAPQALFLRFVYELRGSEVPEDEAERHALRQAYYFADVDATRQIRALAPIVL